MLYRLAILLILISYLSVTTMGQSLMKNTPKSKNNNSLNQITALLGNDSILNPIFQMNGFEQIKSDAIASLKNVKSVELLDRLNNTIKKARDLKNVYQSTVVNINYYGTNQTDSFSVSNNFTNANAQFNLKVFDIPFSVQTSAVFEQGKLRTEFSYTNIQFNWEQYRETLRQKVSVNILNDYFKVDQITQQLKIGKIDSAALVNDVKFELYNLVINNPKVNQLKYDVQYQLDSFINHTDSLGRNKFQKNIDSLNVVKQNVQKFEQEYEALWEKRKQIFASIEQLKSKLTNTEQELKKLSDPYYLKGKASQYKSLNLKDRLMLNTKGLDFGQFGVDEDDFTIKNQLLNGVRYEYEGRKNTFGFIIGNSRLRGLETPVYYNPFQRALLGRQFLYFKYGYTMPDSSRILFKVLNAHKTNDTLFRGATTADYNTILGVSYEKKLSKKWSVLTEFAYSNLRGDFVSTVERPQKFSDDLAASSSLFLSHKEVFKIGLGYFYVGNHFITYGNDFLLNNRNGVKLDAQTAVFKNKLKFKVSLKTGFLNDPSVFGLSKSVAIQMTGDVNWQISKNGSIQFQYSPNTITQAYGNPDSTKGYDYKTNIYLLSGIFNYRIGQNRQSTFVMLSNLNQQVDYFDSLRFNKTFFTNIRQESFITDKSSLVLSSNLGFANDFKTIQTGLIQSDIRFQVNKKWRVIGGLQIAKKLTDVSWRGGGVTNISLNLNKLNIRCGIIYRKPLISGLAIKDEWIGNTSVTMTF